MAEKELRKMNRTELIEIIYALQQNEKSLRQENEDLHEQLEDKIIRMEQAGSIAEAALSLNHIFEDAEEAARQYLNSVQAARGPVEEQAQEILAGASQRAESILADASQQAGDLLKAAKEKEERADALIRQTEEECQAKRARTGQECEERLAQTEQECMELLSESKQKARDRIENVNRKINLLMKKYPMLREYLEKENGTGGEST
ncbi:MAG: hypothetical protein LUI10_14410 [Lachnospiraceae bacterium]|nr:hypothetical protein [Lachnospiraceae bacterium]